MSYFRIHFLWVYLFPTLLFSQINIHGTITDKESKVPIEAVTIFATGTESGTLSDENGYFELKDVKAGNIELIFSRIGYRKQRIDMGYTELGDFELNMQMSVQALELDAVSITASKDKRRKKQLARFRKAFLGETAQASQCSILNPGVIHFREEKDQTLSAWTHDLIEIENQATGYKVFFSLDTFMMKGAAVTYAGKPYFEALEPQNDRDLQKWNRKRKLTYEGSRRHFFQNLISGNIYKSGFEISYSRLNADKSEFSTLGMATPKEIFTYDQNKRLYYLQLKDFLRIVYTKEYAPAGLTNDEDYEISPVGQPDNAQARNRGFNAGNTRTHQISYLYSLGPRIPIDPNGFILRPQLVREYGYWAYEGLAELLPREYGFVDQAPDIQAELERQDIREKKGFILSSLRIPLEEIIDGGPPKDGIPSIDHPTFLASTESDFLKDNEHVLGLVVNGIAKAYPIKILDRHEIVNDDFGGEAVVITFCPLCGSGMSFSAMVNGKKRTFGVSGLLYNSDVLLYDRETESLWSQIMSESVSGPESGSILDYIPTTFTTWKQWRTMYPNTKVLSPETGYNINYNRQAYAGYEDSERLIFPVKEENKILPNKEKVLGLRINGQYKAYPFSTLSKVVKQGKLIDTFAGEEFHVYYNRASNSAFVKDKEGNMVESVRLFWFAWYAFHPNTEVYQKKK